MLDFSNEEDQKSSGAIPKGSCVKVRLHIRQPRLENREGDYFVKADTGLLGLDAEYEVVAGAYAGRKIWDTIWLPKQYQKIRLTEGQTKACNMAGAKIKAILGSSKGNYQMQSWFDLNNVEFGVIVGLSKEANSKGYWNNTIAKIITPAMNHYREVMAGGEVITDGPTSGETSNRNNNQSFSEDDLGPDFPSESGGMDDVPF